MKEIIVRPMQCAIATGGLLRIDRIGSGVGIVIFNSAYKVAAGVHVLRGESPGGDADNPAYYANTAIPYILQEFERRGVSKPFSVAVAGAASMMSMPDKDNAGSKLLVAVKAALAKEGLPVKLEETGDVVIRSILLNVDAGKIKIV